MVYGSVDAIEDQIDEPTDGVGERIAPFHTSVTVRHRYISIVIIIGVIFFVAISMSTGISSFKIAMLDSLYEYNQEVTISGLTISNYVDETSSINSSFEIGDTEKSFVGTSSAAFVEESPVQTTGKAVASIVGISIKTYNPTPTLFKDAVSGINSAASVTTGYGSSSSGGTESGFLSISGSSLKSYNPTPTVFEDSTFRPTYSPSSLTEMEPDLTQEPSFKPTHKPSMSPSHKPTNKPTHKPSREPTRSSSDFSDNTDNLEPTIKPTKKPTKVPSASPTALEDTSFRFTLSRSGYDPLTMFIDDDTIFAYRILDSYSAIIEPYVSTELHIRTPSAISDGNGVYSFQLCSTIGSGSDCQSGLKYELSSENDVTVKVECKAFATYNILVTHSDSSGAVKFTNSGSAICMYVRREMRSLTTPDLDATLEAMYQLWALSEQDGQTLYGDEFHNSTYFTSAHHFNAAWQDGDHIHEGLGFFPQHIKLTNKFEAAMQAVDPAVSLPYWDFTIENEAGITIFDSPIFQAATFGSLHAPANGEYWSYGEDDIGDGVIKDGRWAQILSDYNMKYDKKLQNSFGFMRGPWNMNPSPYVTRFASEVTSIPGCSAYYQWAATADFGDFLKAAPYLPHASLHGAIGGVFGCDVFDDLLDAGLILDDDSKLMICTKWGFYLKELYRADYIAPNDGCAVTSMDKDGIDCGFTCNSDTYDDMPSKMKLTVNNAYMPKDMDMEKWGKWRDFVCSGNGFRVFVGDQLESASPSDPSFWPIHPTQERIYHARLMAGGFDDYDWPSDASVEYVCDKSQCYEDYEETKDYFDECCYGHFENDQLLDFETGDKASGVGPTNKKLLADIDASSNDYSVSYIYDDFTWSHCSTSDFASLFTSLLDSARKLRGIHS